MKILQINSWFSRGGPPRIVNGIYDTLIECGHECKIAAARAEMYKPEDSIMIGGKYAPYINALSCRVFDDDGFRSKRATKQLVREIKKYDPDIIHLHNLHSYYLNIEILFDYLRTCGKKVFWTLHDCWSFTGHCAHFTAEGCYKWRTQCHDCTLKKSFPTCIVHSNAKENFERKKKAFTGLENLTIVTVSEWLKYRVEESFLSEYPIAVIPNGIDLDVFMPTENTGKFSLPQKKIILGVAQNWGQHKGFYDFIRLSKLINEDYQIVMVGVTEKQKKELPKEIIAISRTNNSKELAELYSLAEVYINFSVEETMGLTTVEALACGTPAIVYNRTAVPEVIDDSCGWVIEPGDFESVLNILNNMNPKSYYSKMCISRARNYEKRKQYNRYIELYQSLL